MKKSPPPSFFRYLFISLLSLLCLCAEHPTKPDAPLVICGQNDSHTAPANVERFGFFSESLYVNYKARLASFSSLYGVKPAFVLWFQQIDDVFPMTFVTDCADLSIKTVISLNIKSLNADSIRNDTLLREINDGLWDTTLRAFAKQAKQSGATIYLRFGYEMNGNWFPWGGKPGDFIAAWNRAHKIFQNEQANNVLWIFSPGVLFDGATVNQDLDAYYPGDSVVDINGLDGYNYGDNVIDGYPQHWKSFQEVFGPSLIALKAFSKPIWITEIGCPFDERRPNWITQLLNFMDNNPCVETMLWFDDNKVGEPDFRLESDSMSVKLIKNWFAHK